MQAVAYRTVRPRGVERNGVPNGTRIGTDRTTQGRNFRSRVPAESGVNAGRCEPWRQRAPILHEDCTASPCLGNEADKKGAREARSNLIYRDGHPPPEARQMQMRNAVSPLFSVSQRAPQRRQGTHSFWLPSFRPHLLARLHVLIGSPASDPGGAPCAATSTSRREGCGGSRLPANQHPDYGQPTELRGAHRHAADGETARTSCATACGRDRLAEVQHMEAAAKRFTERAREARPPQHASGDALNDESPGGVCRGSLPT